MAESTTDWRELLGDYQDIEIGPPASEELIAGAEMSLGPLPVLLRDLLQQTNGLVCRSFCLYPVFDPSRPKKTWESIQRVNDPRTTRALAADADLLKRFLVFADIGNGFAAMDRNDGTIWFEEESGSSFDQIDLDLREFVEVMITNAV